MKIRKKIIKNFFIQNILVLLAILYIQFVKLTSKIRIENNNYPNKYWKDEKPFILAFWHSQLMMVSFSWSYKKKINILASGHSDGRFGAKVGNFFKLNNIQTSNKNKNLSLRPVFQLLKSRQYIGITPDGPRGPKEKVPEGIIKIAKSTNVPIIPLGYWSSRNFTLRSWDSFLITLPFSKCNFVWGEAIKIPKNLKDNEIIDFQKIIKNKINECIEKAKKNSQ
tara:strand:- start:820 stop:1488 length:669 start_codon:yes stop_codon:yes gene_type:complete